ncbi:RNA-guided endonuclease TnpB family protein [Caminibacter sp.]
MKTFEIRIKSQKDKRFFINYVYKYRHWQNVLTVLAINLFKSNNKDYKHFLDYQVVRACISDTKGSKNKQETIAYIKEKYKENKLYQELISTGKELKVHNLVEIVKRLKKDFSNYFRTLKEYKKNPSKFRGLPRLPKAKKLSRLYNYSIPLDNYVSWSLKKKNLLGINLSKKMRYIYFPKEKYNYLKSKELKSLQVVYKNSEIYLQFAYEEKIAKINYQTDKTASIDVGLNNLITLFIDDKETQSVIIDGSPFKYKNYRYNKLISKLNKSISNEITEWKTTKKGIKIPKSYTEKGRYLKKLKTYIIQRRNDYFKTAFHKIAKETVNYLINHQVNRLILSDSTGSLKNNGECKLRKSTRQNFIQIPFIKLIHYIEEKAVDRGIEVIKVDEAYTSKTSCITEEVLDVQTNLVNAQNGVRTKRGLFKDKTLNKVWNADINGAVNHIKAAFRKSFKWLTDYMWKICNPKKLKSAGEFHYWNSRSNKAAQTAYASSGL